MRRRPGKLFEFSTSSVLTESRVAVVEYDTDQGDYSWFGTPPGTAYSPFQPWHTLARY